MKRKIMALATIFMMLFTNYVFALEASYTRTGGTDISSIKDINDINGPITIDSNYTAVSQKVKYTDNQVEIKDGSGNLIELNPETNLTYRTVTSGAGVNQDEVNTDSLYYKIKMETNTDQELNNVLSVTYKNAIKYKGNNYNVRLNIEKIKKVGNDFQTVRVKIGAKDNGGTESEEMDTNLNNYNKGFYPQIGALTYEIEDGNTKTKKYTEEEIRQGKSNKTEVTVKYYIVDDNGNQQQIAGVFGVEDIDLYQGFYLGDFKVNNSKSNLFKQVDTAANNNLTFYKSQGANGTFFYSTNNLNITDECNIYTLLANNNNAPLDIGLTFDGGCGTPSSTTGKAGAGAYSDLVFLDKVQSRLKVTFDSNGGTNNPDTQYVISGEKAIDPQNTDDPDIEMDAPEKPGYTFVEWDYKDGDKQGQKYDFNTPVTEDVNLIAKYNPIQYKINYVLNDEDDDNKAVNPNTVTQFTVESSDIHFQDPTRPEWDFVDWYSDEECTQKIDGIAPSSPSTWMDLVDDENTITIYAKWKEKTPTPTTATYKVEHWLEDENGTVTVDNKKYKLAYTDDDLEGTIGSTVSATPRSYEGYEPTTTSETKMSGEVTADGGLILKIYYNKKSQPEPQPEPTTATYKIEHWIEDDNGTVTINNKKYKKDVTQDKTGNIGDTVSATPKEYTGYQENTTITEEQGRIPEGVVTEGGGLILRLYYDKKDYKVTFDPQGGEPDPDDQTVKYEEKAEEPDDPKKDGYTFQYWYYINDKGEEVRYDFDTPVVEDVDLIAKWEPVTTITPKEDPSTTPKTELPNAGEWNKVIKTAILSIAILALIIFGGRYYRLKKYMK